MCARHGRGATEMFVRKGGASQKRLGNTGLNKVAVFQVRTCVIKSGAILSSYYYVNTWRPVAFEDF